MRTVRSTSTALLLLLGGCTAIPGLNKPKVSLVPQYSVLKVSGDTSMQSPAPSGPTNNPEQSLDNFGMGSFDGDIGGMVRLGDGFSGIEFGYLRLDNTDTRSGTLTSNWGNLLAGDTVNSKLEGDEFRLRYLGQVIDYENESTFLAGLGFGGMLAHRNFTFRTTAQNVARSQDVTMRDSGVFYIAGRARLGYYGFALTGDYAISPGLNFGGDFDDTLQDAELTLSYTFTDQNVTLAAGYRWEDLPAQGNEGGLDWQMDLRIEGFVLGIEVTF